MADFESALAALQQSLADLDGDGVPDAMQGGSGARVAMQSAGQPAPESYAPSPADITPGDPRWYKPQVVQGPPPGMMQRVGNYFAENDAGDIATDGLKAVGGFMEGLTATGSPLVAPVGAAGMGIVAGVQPVAKMMMNALSKEGRATNANMNSLSRLMDEQQAVNALAHGRNQPVIPYNTLDEGMAKIGSEIGGPADAALSKAERTQHWVNTGQHATHRRLTKEESMKRSVDDMSSRLQSERSKWSPSPGQSGIPEVYSNSQRDGLRQQLTDIITRGPQTPSVKGRQGALSVEQQVQAVERYLDAGGTVPGRSGPWGQKPIGREDVMAILEEMSRRGEL